jgi:predicted nucleotide-binding protein
MPFVLLTPDDLGAERISDEKVEHFNSPDMKLKEQKTKFKYRARQNVIFELGLFIGLLGRKRELINTLGRLVLVIPQNPEYAYPIELPIGLPYFS